MEIARDKRDDSIVNCIELGSNKIETLRKELPQYDIQYYGNFFKFDGRTFYSTRKDDDYFVIYDEGVFETFNREEFDETFDRNLKDFDVELENRKEETVEKFNPYKFIVKSVAWIKDWFRQNGPSCNAVIGMSGGKDSTVAAALCAMALGPQKVIGISMPDSGQSLNDADDICDYLCIRYEKFPIDNAVRAITYGMSEYLQVTPSNQTRQNVPPRIRMAILYAIAQSRNGRVVGTCNASELYIGYATRYGDLASDFEPLASLTCEEVVQVGKALGIPDRWIEKTPDDGLPCSMPDDEKFREQWGFVYKDIHNYLRNGTSGDEEVDKAIEKRHKAQEFKLGLGEVFAYKG